MRIFGPNNFNFKEIEFDEINSINNFICELFDKKSFGVLIKNVIPINEIERIRAFTKNLKENEYQVTGSGFTFPIPFANVQDESSRLSYLKSKQLFNEKCEDLFGYNLNHKIGSIISLVAGNLKIVEPRFKSVENQFASSCQLRYLKENMGGLSAHTGNYFQNMFQYFFNSLDEDIGKYEQLSYFLSIQKPKIGGDLIIYNLTWEDAKLKPDFQSNEYVINKSGEKIFFDKLEKTIISPEPGDLIIFNGGEIWHRVDEIIEKDRITIGGFMAKSKKYNNLYLWA